MSSPRSCRLCPNPVPLESPSGLCPSCAARADTTALSHSTPAGSDLPTSLPDSTAPTATYIPPAPTVESAAWRPPTATDPLGSEAFAPSVSFDVVGDTPAPPGPALPRAPVGYRLLARLGSGGMGDVYLAREQTSERLVAMKFLRFPGNPELLDRFTLELRVLAKLDHPNIVRILSSDFLRSDPFFTMEYLEPGSLAHALRDRTPFAPERAVRITRAIAGALSATHAEGIVHRDLKPSNILLTTDGTPKVADFGLAKRLDEVDPVTAHSVGLGTPSYMPPEQISKRNGTLGPWSDVYGLGATLYHLLTGRAPFLGESPPEIIHQVLADEPCRPRALNPAVPLALEAIVLKCLEKDPKDRYPSMAELVRSLDLYEAGLPDRNTPARTRWRRVQRWVRRKRAVLAVLAAVAVLLVGAVSLGVRLTRPETPRDYVAEYQQSIKAGRSVTLIPEKGLPAWFEQPLGGIELSTPIAADGACVLASVEQSVLVLLPRVEAERYAVEAEFRALRPAGARPQGEDHNQWCGLLVGYDRNPLPNGGRLHSFVAVTFRDFPVAAAAGQPSQPENAKCNVAGLVELPNENPTPVQGNGKYRIGYAASPFHPGKWRRVKFEVAPERIRAFWWVERGPATDTEPPPGAWEPFADWNPDAIRERTNFSRSFLSRTKPDLGRSLSDWSPRNGIAIWCAKSTFAVRNVIVTPEP